jgi:predicted nucleic acid-binding protein
MFWTKPMAVMLCLDVNVLVAAIRPDASHLKVAPTAIEVLRHGTEPVALRPEVPWAF